MAIFNLSAIVDILLRHDLRINITEHAKDRMKKYGISEETVVETLRNPDASWKDAREGKSLRRP